MPVSTLPLSLCLDLPPRPWSLEDLSAAVERHRGRRLIVEPAPLSITGSAIWIATDAADLIVYDQAADPAQRLRAIGHQFGHMLLDHQPSQDGQQLLLPHSESAQPDLAFTISRYRQADELQAGAFASLLAADAMHF
jgi:hypothetical protein